MKYAFFKDKRGKFDIFEEPNVPLWVWIISTALSYIVSHGRFHNLFMFIAGAALVTWAYLEITKGTSSFRRVFGALVLIVTILGRFK